MRFFADYSDEDLAQYEAGRVRALAELEEQRAEFARKEREHALARSQWQDAQRRRTIEIMIESELSEAREKESN